MFFIEIRIILILLFFTRLSLLWVRIQPGTLDSFMRRRYPSWLRNVVGSTQMSGPVWNDGRKGTSRLTSSVRAGKSPCDLNRVDLFWLMGQLSMFYSILYNNVMSWMQLFKIHNKEDHQGTAPFIGLPIIIYLGNWILILRALSY